MTIARLAHGGLAPSRLAMGCEPLGGVDWGDVDPVQARRAVQCALDLGITVFDTADVYGLGRSEEELASALGARRHDAFIVTKFGVRWTEELSGGRARTFKDASPQYLDRALEASLRRLRLDAIPLYLVHWPDPSTPLDDTLEALETHRRKGNVLNYGLSNFREDAVHEAANRFPVSAVEGPYNLIERPAGEAVQRTANRLGMACLAYGVLAQGLLTGKYSPDTAFGPNDRRTRLPQFSPPRWQHNTKVLTALRSIARRHGAGCAEVAIRWVLDSGVVDCAVVGAKSPPHVEATVRALDVHLSPGDMQVLNEVSARPEC